MPSLDFFSQLGIYVDKEFLDEKLCETVCAEMRAGQFVAAEVFDGDRPLGEVNLEVRKVNESRVSSPATSEVLEKLEQLKPRLEKHFGLTLTGSEDTQFLIYQPGDFFSLHQDRGDYPGRTGNASRRQISVVIFLNACSQVATAGSYSGGLLQIYGLLSGEAWENCGLPVESIKGALIAFRSDLIHEVPPVLDGSRYSVVSWFY